MPIAEVLAVVLLLAVLAFAVVRPRGLPEAVAALPAAVVVLATGGIGVEHALRESARLLPVVGFLAAVLVLSELCARDGLFEWAGQWMARRSRGRPKRLLALVFVVAALTTAVLSLDATVVLLTPVVFATATRVGVRARPHVYACTHLANSGSLLLPVSNLTNLLAISALGIGFVQFAVVMLLPWLAVLAVEYLAFRRYFAGDLSVAAGSDVGATEMHLPRFSAITLGLTLLGFACTSFLGLEPAWAAAAGALVLAVRGLLRKQARIGDIAVSLNLSFLAFVIALGIVVAAVVENGLGALLADVVPSGGSLLALLIWAGIGMLLANLVNNLPAALILLPLAAEAGLGPTLAVLIGVNVGPNLTYVGSLATLLWRRVIRAHGHDAPLAEFTWLGLLTTPFSVVVAVLALWASIGLFGGAL